MVDDFAVRRLFAAVVIQAIRDLTSSEGSAVRNSAKRWFEERGTQPFGFYYCLPFCGVGEKLINDYIEAIETGKNFVPHYASSTKYQFATAEDDPVDLNDFEGKLSDSQMNKAIFNDYEQTLKEGFDYGFD